MNSGILYEIYASVKQSHSIIVDMKRTKPTPYAYYPTKSGTKLPWELGKPNDRVYQRKEATESDGSDVEAAPRFTIPDSSDEGEEIADLQPGALFARRHQYAPDPPAEPNPPAARPASPPEARPCTCGRCPEVTATFREKKCCAEENLLRTHLADYEPGVGHCVLESPDIQHCFHPITVRHKWIDQQRYFGHTGQALDPDNMTNKNYRHHSYRTYIHYVHAKLHRYNRKVIPACVVQEIRNLYPDEHGNYVGFVDVDENGVPIPADETQEVAFD